MSTVNFEPEILDLELKCLCLQGTPNHDKNLFVINWLREKVERAQLCGTNRSLQLAMVSEHDDGARRILGLELA